jgi:hypothetical protein
MKTYAITGDRFEAFNLASRTLDRNSRFYDDDYAALRDHYASMPTAKVREALDRFRTCELTDFDHRMIEAGIR